MPYDIPTVQTKLEIWSLIFYGVKRSKDPILLPNYKLSGFTLRVTLFVKEDGHVKKKRVVKWRWAEFSWIVDSVISSTQLTNIKFRFIFFLLSIAVEREKKISNFRLKLILKKNSNKYTCFNMDTIIFYG